METNQITYVNHPRNRPKTDAEKLKDMTKINKVIQARKSKERVSSFIDTIRSLVGFEKGFQCRLKEKRRLRRLVKFEAEVFDPLPGDDFYIVRRSRSECFKEFLYIEYGCGVPNPRLV